VARVLVVDDEPDLRELLRVSLGLAGHDVSTVADGHSGLEAVRRDPPDIVVLDVMMPGLDGWSVLGSLKADPDPAVALVPVVMLTARAEDLDVIKGGIEGAVCYLTKPFSIEELRRVVADAVTGRPEPEQRRAAQQAALVHLARLERGATPSVSSPAKPKMSRLEPVSNARASREAPPQRQEWPSWFGAESLTQRDQEILAVVLRSDSLTDARAHLQVSRSYLYSRLRRVASRLGFESGPALLRALRAANALKEREPRRTGPAAASRRSTGR
jgi:CheY-like chemotaxis protein